MKNTTLILLGFVAVAFTLPAAPEDATVDPSVTTEEVAVDRIMKEASDSVGMATALMQEADKDDGVKSATKALAAKIAKEDKAKPAAAAPADAGAKQSKLAIAKAKLAKDEQQAAAKKEAAAETKWQKEETAYAKEAHALNKAARAAQRQAAASNAKDAAQLKKYEAQASKKMAAATHDTAAAEAEYKSMQERMKGVEDKMKREKAAARVRQEAEVKQYKKDMKELKSEIDTEKKAHRKAQNTAKKDQQKFKKEKADIETNYKTTMSHLKKVNKEARHKLEAEQKTTEETLAKQAKTNEEKALAEKAALKKEAADNAANAAKEKATIKKRFDKLEAEHKKADDLLKAKEAAAAAALKASRAATKAKFDKQAKKDEDEYLAAMREAAVLKHKADNAQKEYNDSVKKAAEEQKEADASAKKAADEDAAMHECGDKECQAKDGSCKKTGLKGKELKKGEKTLYLAPDLFSCTDKPPKKQMYAGEKWAGIPPPLPRPPPEAPSKACIAGKQEFVKGPYGFAMHGDPDYKTNPIIAIACKKKVDSPLHLLAQRKALESFFKLAAICPPWCMPGTATNDGLVQDTDGICLTGADLNMFAQQIHDLPQWKAMGFGKKIPANYGIMDICTMAKKFIKGWRDGGEVHKL